jgi:hypothetical protein
MKKEKEEIDDNDERQTGKERKGKETVIAN